MTPFQSCPLAWKMISGEEQILEQKPLLQELARRSGQDGILEFLEYFVTAPYFGLNVPETSWRIHKLLPDAVVMQRTRLPVLLLGSCGSEIEAAVLAFEYRIYGLPTRCFIPLDEDGYRSVIAPGEQRAEAALQAGAYLLSKGALVALMSYMPDSGSEEEPGPAKLRGVLGHQSRMVERRLQLHGTIDDTLASMSRNTRHNLRRSKLQIVEGFDGTYVPNATLTDSELLGLSRSSQFSAPDWAARKRYESARDLKSGVLAGLRAADGLWLSLVGGHREGDTVCLDWQLNRSELNSISVATAMRAFLIEDEILRGTRWVRFERGTTHPMHRAFVKERTQDLLFAQRVLPRRLIRHLAAGAKGGLLPTVLGSPSLVWSH